MRVNSILVAGGSVCLRCFFIIGWLVRDLMCLLVVCDSVWGECCGWFLIFLFMFVFVWLWLVFDLLCLW